MAEALKRWNGSSWVTVTTLQRAFTINNETSCLLHFEGYNGATTYKDEYGGTWYSSGNAKLSTNQKKFGSTSAYFDGYGDYIYADGSNSRFQFYNSDFTMDFWWRPVSASGWQFFYNHVHYHPDTGVTDRVTLYADLLRNRILFIMVKDSGGTEVQCGMATGTYSFVNDSWCHFAITRHGNDIYMFVNGAQIPVSYDYQFGVPMPAITDNVYIGVRIWGPSIGPDRYLAGYLDEFRITRRAVWTGPFTVPASAYYLKAVLSYNE